jgi:hypothetical protein
MVSGDLKDCNAFIFRIRQSKTDWNAGPWKVKTLRSFVTLVTIN